jgi:hypothetical protein
MSLDGLIPGDGGNGGGGTGGGATGRSAGGVLATGSGGADALDSTGSAAPLPPSDANGNGNGSGGPTSPRGRSGGNCCGGGGGGCGCFSCVLESFRAVGDMHRRLIGCRARTVSHAASFWLFVVAHVVLLTVQLWFVNSPDPYFVVRDDGTPADPYDWVMRGGADGTVFANVSAILRPNCSFTGTVFQTIQLNTIHFDAAAFFLQWKQVSHATVGLPTARSADSALSPPPYCALCCAHCTVQYYYVNILTTVLLATVWVVSLYVERLEENSRVIANVCGWSCNRSALTIAKRGMAVLYMATIPVLLPALIFYKQFFGACGLPVTGSYLRDFEPVPLLFKLLTLVWVSLWLVTPVVILLMAIIALFVDGITCHGACCCRGNASRLSLFSELIGLSRQRLFYFEQCAEANVISVAASNNARSHANYDPALARADDWSASAALFGPPPRKYGTDGPPLADILLPSAHPHHHRRRSSPSHGGGGGGGGGGVASGAVGALSSAHPITTSPPHSPAQSPRNAQSPMASAGFVGTGLALPPGAHNTPAAFGFGEAAIAAAAVAAAAHVAGAGAGAAAPHPRTPGRSPAQSTGTGAGVTALGVAATPRRAGAPAAVATHTYRSDMGLDLRRPSIGGTPNSGTDSRRNSLPLESSALP